MSGSDAEIVVSVGEEELASFTIKTQPAPSATLTIDENSKSIEFNDLLTPGIDFTMTPAETDYSSDTFTLTVGNLGTYTLSVEAGMEQGSYAAHCDETFTSSNNGEYNSTLKCIDPLTSEVIAQDTLTVTINFE